jgi:hypothetical protein
MPMMAEEGISVTIIIDVRAIAGISVIVRVVRVIRRIVPVIRHVTIRSKVRTEPVGKLKIRAISRDVKRIYERRCLI